MRADSHNDYLSECFGMVRAVDIFLRWLTGNFFYLYTDSGVQISIINHTSVMNLCSISEISFLV